MTSKASPLKRAIHAAKEAMGPQPHRINGKPITCPICRHERFQPGDYVALLLMHTLVCEGCSHVEFFKDKPESVDE